MPTRTHRTLAALALLATIASSALAQLAPPDYDRWYGVFVGEGKAGHAHMVQRTAEDGSITTSNVMDFTVARMGMEVGMQIESVIIESADHEILRVEFAQRLGTGTSVEATYLFEDDQIVKVSQHMGDEVRSAQPRFDLDYLSPVEARRYIVGTIDAGERELKYVTLDASFGLRPVQTVTTLEGPQAIDSYGRETVALRVKSVSSANPSVEVTEFLDEQALPLRTELKMGTIPMRLVAMTKEDALSEGPGIQPELFAPTLVAVDPPIADARSTRTSSMVLEVTEGELPDMLDGGAFSFERLGPTTGRVRVDLGAPRPAPNADKADTRYIRSTTYANIDDALVRRLARAGVRDAPDDTPSGRASALRTYVYDFIEEKNLGTGFATASEVCRTASGDCSEHAVLLAALLRAERIPSRVVSGLIYADAFAGERSVFGFHMWTQALLPVNGRMTWVDLDATLPEGVEMDAAHIAVSTFDLSDEDFIDAMNPVVALLGALSVEVESVGRD